MPGRADFSGHAMLLTTTIDFSRGTQLVWNRLNNDQDSAVRFN